MVTPIFEVASSRVNLIWRSIPRFEKPKFFSVEWKVSRSLLLEDVSPWIREAQYAVRPLFVSRSLLDTRTFSRTWRSSIFVCKNAHWNESSDGLVPACATARVDEHETITNDQRRKRSFVETFLLQNQAT